MPYGKPSLALFTAFYELTMAQAYWKAGQTAHATFSLTIRSYPQDRAYLVFAGLGEILEYLEGFHFAQADIDYLRSLRRFDEAFLEYLQGLRFSGSVRALEEGTIFFAQEPVLEVSAPIIQAQILENYLLNRVNLNVVMATKASRIVHAASGKPVVEFASRRAPGIDAADVVSRVCYMVGFAGTGNVHAAARFRLPPTGTMAHSFVTSFLHEADAFSAYATAFPQESSFLVDSYDTVEGTKNAVRVAREMRGLGHELRAIRLDSGDLLDLSHRCRALLDEAGFPNVKITASGDLDEHAIDSLVRSGAAIDSFGIGTKLGTSSDAPWTDCVYKLASYGGRPAAKFSPSKQTLPGAKQVYRLRDSSGDYIKDDISLADEDPPIQGGEHLLKAVMEQGRPLGQVPDLPVVRERFREEFAHLPVRYKLLRSPPRYPIVLSEKLQHLQQEIARQVKASIAG